MAIENAMVRAPLIIIAITILLGTTIAEFFTSSPVPRVLVVQHINDNIVRDVLLI